MKITIITNIIVAAICFFSGYYLGNRDGYTKGKQHGFSCGMEAQRITSEMSKNLNKTSEIHE